MKDFLKEAQKLQAKFLEQLRSIKVEGSAGGGMVKIEMDGEHNVLSIKIEPHIVQENDTALIEDLILAAFSDAKRKVTEKTQESFKSITGLPFPM